MWTHIKKLRNRNKKQEEELKLYDEQGRQLNDEESVVELKKYWSNIYKMYENKIGEVWNLETQKRYIEEKEGEMKDGQGGKIVKIGVGVPVTNMDHSYGRQEVRVAEELREHMDMAFEMGYKFITYMKKTILTVGEVKDSLHKLKNRKAAGLDALIKSEFYKCLVKSDICVNKLSA